MRTVCGNYCNMDDPFSPSTGQWVELDLATIPIEEPYREEVSRWAASVDWAAVNEVALSLLESHELDDMNAVERAGEGLRAIDMEALVSLVYWQPIDANSDQITNGIHRTTAMRNQGVKFTLALVPVDLD